MPKKGGKDYKCKLCNKAFKSSKNLRKHAYNNHFEDDINDTNFKPKFKRATIAKKSDTECSECGQDYFLAYELFRHQQLRHVNPPVAEILKPKEIKSEPVVAVHCDFCGLDFYNLEHLEEHTIKCKQSRGYYISTQSSSDKVDIINKNTVENVSEDDESQLDNVKNSNIEKVGIDKKTVLTIKVKRCHLCGEVFVKDSTDHDQLCEFSVTKSNEAKSGKYAKTKNQGTKENITLQKCKVKKKEVEKKDQEIFGNKSKINNISATSYKCSKCEKSFTNEKESRNHNMMHTLEVSLVCKQCAMEFSSANEMKDHMLLHTEKVMSNSNIETKAFKKISDEKLKDVHKSKESSSNSPFQCTICKRKFAREHHLKSHKLIHELSLQIR